MIFRKPFILAILAALVFFVAALLTLPNYGISWDEPTHFKRGQGYLRFLLTGDNDYRKLPPYDLNRAQTDPDYNERSIYQDDRHNAAFYRTIDGTHPPLADILASATNMVFYQKLGLLGDVESYHLFEIFVASLGVAVLFLFVYESFGLLAATLSAILFATYPLFWAEAHFNIKDPIETSWIILTLYFFWKGIKSSSARLLFVSSVFAGFAFATKWNVIFLPFIVGPWLLFVLKAHRKKFLAFIKSKSFVLVALLYPLVVFGIFYFSYPFLWPDPVAGINKVLTYYQNNALDPAFANAALETWPFYAVRWVLLTAPPLVLLGLLLNILFLRENLTKHHGFLLLVYLWLLVTVVRVSIPGVNIYGGVRQIMEYIPAMAVLAGIGASELMQNLKFKMQNYNPKFKKFFVFDLSFLFLIFTFSITPIWRLHPNENVYFNFLAGGLRGAIESGVPAAGHSFGNAYYQGVAWINENVEEGAKLTLLQGSAVNIPSYKLRQDIDFSGDHFSGINREGEYLMELTFNWEHRQNFYAWEYVERFLEPVYEIKVDGVSILKVWKNDLEHTKPSLQLEEKVLTDGATFSKEGKHLVIELEDEALLSRIIFSYESSDICSLPGVWLVETSIDGKEWRQEKDPLTFIQVGKKLDTFRPAWAGGEETEAVSPTLNFYFAAREARFIRLVFDDANSCGLNNPQVELHTLSQTSQLSKSATLL